MSPVPPPRLELSPRPLAFSRWLLASAYGLAALGGPALAADAQTPFDQMVVFGDSISDGGTYSARAKPGAGSFTTNPDPVWVEVIASTFRLDLTPHALDGGTNYAEGGARVATPRPNAPGDLSRRPLTQQIDDFLGNGGVLGPNSLVIIQGGGNDVFYTQSNGLSFTPEDLAVLDSAAKSLADQVERLSAAGAGTIVTTSVPRFEVFNQRYEAALVGRKANVLYVDLAALIAEIEADPAPFGISNIKDPACRGSAVQSFTCLPSDYVTPDANKTYLFADGVHFTGVVQEIEADATLAAVLAPGQISQIPYLIQAGAQSQRSAVAGEMQADRTDMAGAWSLFGSASGDRFDLNTGAQHIGLQSDAGRLNLGARYAIAGRLAVGGVLGWSDAEGEFGQNQGKLDARTISVTAFGAGRLGALDMLASVEYADIDLDDIRRHLTLGPAIRNEVGETEGRLWAVDFRADRDLAPGALAVRPMAGLRYEHIKIDGYAEAGQRSTQMTFSAQELETLVASVGVAVSWDDPAAAVQPFVSLAYDIDLLENDRQITVTPNGAPVSFTTEGYTADLQRLSYTIGAKVRVRDDTLVVIGVSGLSAEEAGDALSGFVGGRLRF